MQHAVAGQPDPKIDGLSRDQRFFLGWATAFRTQITPEYAQGAGRLGPALAGLRARQWRADERAGVCHGVRLQGR